MSNLTLMAMSGAASTGAAFNIGTSVSTLNIQCTPQASIGFSGTVLLSGSTAVNPGASDWFPIATMIFNAHTTVLDFNLYFTNNPWIQVSLPANATFGAVAVYAAY
jgi:hypothetical protein